MNTYELNGLGKDWYFYGNTEEEAQQEYFNDLELQDLSDYENYMESIDQEAKLEWKLVENNERI